MQKIVKKIVKEHSTNFTEDEVFTPPDIPNKKLEAAFTTLQIEEFVSKEDVLMLADFCSVGALLTPVALYLKSGFGKPRKIEFMHIRRIVLSNVSDSVKTILINNHKYLTYLATTTKDKQSIREFADMLKNILNASPHRNDFKGLFFGEPDGFFF